MAIDIKFIFIFQLLSHLISVSGSCIDSACVLNKDSLKWTMIGDWGGIPIWPWYTYAQNKVANSLGSLANRENTDFQISLGDNFYFYGVKNDRDSRFQNSFEDVYTADSLKTPWYIVAGNHDHYGNVTGQIQYTKRSQRWTFPSLWYNFSYALSDSTRADFVMIDTVTLCGNTRTIKKKFGKLKKLMGLESHDPQGPEDEQKSEEQWTWIEEQLRNSRAEYLFVVGHFPVYSVGRAGPTKCLVDRLLPLLHTYKVTAYFSGHDHNLQHLNSSKDGWITNFIVSGAGGFIDKAKKHMNSVPQGALQYMYPSDGWSPFGLAGFTNGAYVYAQVDRNKAVFKFLKGNEDTLQNSLHSFELSPRHI